MFRSALNFFRGPRLAGDARVFERHTRAFLAAQTLVRAYYAMLLFFAASSLPAWIGWRESRAVTLRWPVMWAEYVGESLAWQIVLPFFLLSALLTAAFPHVRFLRISVWIGLFQWAALRNSLGNITHNLHILVLSAFVLIFLPSIEQAPKKGTIRARQLAYLTIVGGAQAFTLMTYTMAGIGKIVYLLYQSAAGQAHALSPDGLAIHVASCLVPNNLTTLMGPWLIEHSQLALPLMVGVLYVQFFSFWAAFRPAIHTLWGIMLIGFHIGTCALMGILSVEHVLCVGIFMFASPFGSSKKWSIDDVLGSLPVVGELRARAIAKYSAR